MIMISVIIPTFNEESHIKATIRILLEYDKAKLIKEIIIADGGSTDNTVEVARAEGIQVITSPQKGRAAQMNVGASAASGEVFYFLHADTVPPLSFTQDISDTIKRGFDVGCYRLSFNHEHWFLKANCWFTRFDVDAIRFGDQSIFVRKDKFIEAGGFCEKHIIMEDQELIKRLKKISRFTVIQKPVLTSARKYLENGIYKTQLIFFIIFSMYKLGCNQQKLVTTYRRLIKQDKL